jgi:hypothetical protein
MKQVSNCLLLCLEDGGDIFPRNVGWLATNYTALYPRRNKSSMLCCFENFLADCKIIKITPHILPTIITKRVKRKDVFALWGKVTKSDRFTANRDKHF